MTGYLGADVSKGYADFTLIDAEQNELESVFQLDDTRKGHDSLRRHLEKVIKRHHLTHLYCGLESTGGLENNWLKSLSEWSNSLPISVARLNPTGVKRNAQASLNRNITDSLSSRYIAQYLVTHPKSVNYAKDDGNYSSFRSLHKHILLLKKQQTQLTNQLKSQLYFCFPELVRYCKNTTPNWILELLQKFPTVTKIAHAKVEQLMRINHVDKEKAMRLIQKAKESVASRQDKVSGFLTSSLAEQILEKQQLVETHKKFLEDSCKGEEVTLTESIVGIGTYSAAALMIEIEYIKRFPSPKHLVGYFGTQPELKESGDKKLKARMSKKGRSAVRGILYMCARTAVIYDAHMRKIYHKHRSNGKNHNEAIGVIMTKLLRIIWGVLTHKQKYNVAVDQKNQEKVSIEKKNETLLQETTAKRRYQEHDSEAPITGQQTRKRKVYSESQVP